MFLRLSQAQRRRAVAAVQIAVVTPVMVSFSALAVDVGAMYNARAGLQRCADAAALAAIGVVAKADAASSSIPVATQTAVEYVAANPVLGRVLTIEPDTDVIFGRAHFNAATSAYNFVPGETPINAVRTIVRHTEASPNGAVPLYFAPIFGKSATDITAEAVALYVDTHYELSDCHDTVSANEVMLCHVEGDSDDSDDSASGASDDSDDSDSGDSDGSHNGDPDDSDDSEAGGSDDSDDSNDTDDSGGYHPDSESAVDSTDSDSPHTILADSGATGYFLNEGDTLGPCDCPPGDSDDSDDSQGEFGPADSSDSDDSDPGDSDGSTDGDSDDSDDSQGEHGPPDSDDSDDSHAGGDSDSDVGDSDDSDHGHGASDDSDDSGHGDSDDSDDSQGDPEFDSDDSGHHGGSGAEGGMAETGGDNSRTFKIFLIE